MTEDERATEMETAAADSSDKGIIAEANRKKDEMVRLKEQRKEIR